MNPKNCIHCKSTHIRHAQNITHLLPPNVSACLSFSASILFNLYSLNIQTPLPTITLQLRPNVVLEFSLNGLLNREEKFEIPLAKGHTLVCLTGILVTAS